jgi:hypothetical protein
MKIGLVQQNGAHFGAPSLSPALSQLAPDYLILSLPRLITRVTATSGFLAIGNGIFSQQLLSFLYFQI